MRAMVFGVAIFLATASACLGQVEEISLQYTAKPPYLIPQDDGTVIGLTGSPIGAAFRQAGIPFKWTATPVSRSMALLKQGTGQDCIAGLYKTPERAGFAKFTNPVYRDSRYVLVARQDFPYRDGESLISLLDRKDVMVYVKQDNSYGAYIDNLLAKLAPDHYVTTLDTRDMLAFISAKHGDFMFATEDEANYYLTAEIDDKAGLKILKIPDTPPGELRYILCSKAVPDSTIDRLNSALPSLR